jgi:fumarate reductase flavoprotein subunit
MGTAAHDFIAVGAGLAGLTAANRALELGQKTLVLERSTIPRHPCASRTNGGVFHIGFRSVSADPSELVAVIDSATGRYVEPQVARALANNGMRSIQWLESFGTVFASMQPSDGWKDFCLAPLGFHNKTTLEWKGLGADRLIDRLEARTKELGGASLRGRIVTDLIVEDGTVRGVIAKGPQGREEYRARAVVLADGGFEANQEMVRRFITPHPENLKLRGTESGYGDGMRLAEKAGGKLVGMEAFYGHILSADSLHLDTLSPFPFLEFLASSGMMLDREGNRFVDESLGGHFTSNALARHGDGLANVLFDNEMWDGIGRHFFCPPNPNLVAGGGTLHQADNIAGLARLIGLEPAQLERSVEAHNAQVARDAKKDAETSGARATMTAYAKGKHKPQAFKAPPYYAAPACAALTSTLGGIAIDANGRVLRAAGGVIPGLYAAGSVTGSAEGGPEVGYLGGLIKSLVFGLLAAEHAASAAGAK